MIKKDAFQWGEIPKVAFEAFIMVMTQAPALALPDFNQPFIIEIDGCNASMWAILQQKGYSIVYVSKASGAKGQELSIYK